jgi:hypothetical protein
VLEHVNLDSLGIFSRKFEGYSGGGPARRDVHFMHDVIKIGHYLSWEIIVPQEEINRYRNAINEIEWFRLASTLPNLTTAQRSENWLGIQAIEKWLDDSFGDEEFRPDPDFWTDDGYRNITGTSSD